MSTAFKSERQFISPNRIFTPYWSCAAAGRFDEERYTAEIELGCQSVLGGYAVSWIADILIYKLAWAKQPMSEIYPVRQHFASETALIAPGKPGRCFLKISRPAGEMNKGVDTADPSNLTVLDFFLNEAAGESSAMVEVNDIGQSGFCNSCCNLPAPGEIDAQRFLTVDCLAGINSGQDIVAMTIRWAGDIDHINRRITEYLIRIFGNGQVLGGGVGIA